MSHRLTFTSVAALRVLLPSTNAAIAPARVTSPLALRNKGANRTRTIRYEYRQVPVLWVFALREPRTQQAAQIPNTNQG